MYVQYCINHVNWYQITISMRKYSWANDMHSGRCWLLPVLYGHIVKKPTASVHHGT